MDRGLGTKSGAGGGILIYKGIYKDKTITVLKNIRQPQRKTRQNRAAG